MNFEGSDRFACRTSSSLRKRAARQACLQVTRQSADSISTLCRYASWLSSP